MPNYRKYRYFGIYFRYFGIFGILNTDVGISIGLPTHHYYQRSAEGQESEGGRFSFRSDSVLDTVHCL